MFQFFGKLVGWGLMALTALALIAFPSGVTVAVLVGLAIVQTVRLRRLRAVTGVLAEQVASGPVRNDAALEAALMLARQVGAQEAVFEIMRRQDA